MQIKLCRRPGTGAFTLAEIVVSFAIMALVIGGMITGYTRLAQFSARASYELAAEAQAVQVMEQVRAAKWDTTAVPPVDYTTNFPRITTNLMELPITGTNVVYCTNYLSVTTITNSTALGTVIKMIQVNTFYPWNGGVFSNTLVTYRAPDQ